MNYHKAVGAAKKAVASTVSFVKNHAATIASVVVGAGTFLGCEALSMGVGTIGCAALAGAASSGVSYLMSCGKTQQGCSLKGGLEATGEGAISGVVGAALAGPLGGKLASEALDGILPDVATNALVGTYAGTGSGAVSGAIGYAASCGSSQQGCSWSGLAGATASGAGEGSLAGGIGGAGASLLGSGISALRGSGGEDAPEAGASEDATGCPTPHSFVGSTKVLMADGSLKDIGQIKVGDEIANSVPGTHGLKSNAVTAVIVTKTDHDFVDVTIKPDSAGGSGESGSGEAGGTAQASATTAASPQGQTQTGPSGLAAKVLKKTAVGLAAALATLAGTSAIATGNGAGSGTASGTSAATASVSASVVAAAADGGTLTTTYHHPFYDETQAAFVDAQYLKPGDRLQTPIGDATVTALRFYHSTTVTYDLTIGALHTYYVLAGSVAVLVHNCGNESEAVAAQAAAQDLNGLRSSATNEGYDGSSWGTTTVMGIRNTMTGKISIRTGINGAGEAPNSWPQWAKDAFVQAPGHAEQGIVNSLADN